MVLEGLSEEVKFTWSWILEGITGVFVLLHYDGIIEIGYL
jgi:hypothetical protein